jgi:hypothetical protein
MKSKLFSVLSVLLVISIGIGLIGCASTEPVTFESIIPDSTPTPFEGTWVHPNPESQSAKIIFSGNSFSYQWDTGNRDGRFTYTGTRINFLVNDGKKWTTSYKINNGQLRLEQGTGGWHWYGDFIGIDANQNIPLDGTWKHPVSQAQEATYIFNGNQFEYSRNNGFTGSGEFGFTGNKLTINVSGQVVREYMCYFQNNSSNIILIGISGDGNNYYQGPFDKQ